jgi:phosphoglucosamine mutase
MRKNGFNLGGEQSGHIIFLDHSTTGDGCIAALNVLAVMRQTGVKMSDLNRIIEDVPQVLINCRVKVRKELSALPGYTELVKGMEQKLNKDGRIFVRFSGTEPLIRILVEGPNKMEITSFAQTIAEFLEKNLAS